MPNDGDVPTDEPGEPVEAPEPEPAAAPPPAPQRLTRSRDDRVIAGVCGGLGQYLGVDAVLIRIAALILVVAGGAGVVLYLIGWIAMPEEDEFTAAAGPGSLEASAARPPTSGAVVLGLVFVVLGVFFLLDEIWPDFLSWTYIWPAALIAIGIAILLRRSP
jgi:phage shock protein C